MQPGSTQHILARAAKDAVRAELSVCVPDLAEAVAQERVSNGSWVAQFVADGAEGAAQIVGGDVEQLCTDPDAIQISCLLH